MRARRPATASIAGVAAVLCLASLAHAQETAVRSATGAPRTPWGRRIFRGHGPDPPSRRSNDRRSTRTSRSSRRRKRPRSRRGRAPATPLSRVCRRAIRARTTRFGSTFVRSGSRPANLADCRPARRNDPVHTQGAGAGDALFGPLRHRPAGQPFESRHGRTLSHRRHTHSLLDGLQQHYRSCRRAITSSSS